MIRFEPRWGPLPRQAVANDAGKEGLPFERALDELAGRWYACSSTCLAVTATAGVHAERTPVRAEAPTTLGPNPSIALLQGAAGSEQTASDLAGPAGPPAMHKALPTRLDEPAAAVIDPASGVALDRVASRDMAGRLGLPLRVALAVDQPAADWPVRFQAEGAQRALVNVTWHRSEPGSLGTATATKPIHGHTLEPPLLKLAQASSASQVVMTALQSAGGGVTLAVRCPVTLRDTALDLARHWLREQWGRHAEPSDLIVNGEALSPHLWRS